jgi:serine/threonine protein kinase
MAAVLEISYDGIQRAIDEGGATVIGEGSYGPVYQCALLQGGPLDGRRLAIKIVRDDLREAALGNAEQEALFERMFMAEVCTLGHLRHRNIVRLLSYSRGEAGRRALVYELLEGGSLLGRLHGGEGERIGAKQRIDIAVDVARGLAHLHGLALDTFESPAGQAGAAGGAGGGGDGDKKTRSPVLHRDIKSANIALDAEGMAKLIDCGLAKTVDDTSRSLLSITGGSALGTPGYIAPEVTDGVYGVASEIYSVGVVLLELLTGKKALGLVRAIQDAREDAVDKDEGRAGRQKFLDAFQVNWADPACGWGGRALTELRDLALQCVERSPRKRPNNAGDVFMRLLGVQSTWAAENEEEGKEGKEGKDDMAGGNGSGGITVEEYRRLETELAEARSIIQSQKEEEMRQFIETNVNSDPRLWDENYERQQRMEFERLANAYRDITAVAEEEEMRTCCVSYEEDCPISQGILCGNGHFLSDDYTDQYVATQNAGVVADNPDLGRVADVGILRRANRADGSMYCPLRGQGGCTAPPYREADIARHVSSETFDGYIEVKMLVAEKAVHDRAQADIREEVERINSELTALGQHNIQVSRDRLREELQRQFPNAYQCGGCGFGPIDHTACSDLRAHHGQSGYDGQGGQINNACPRCSWFSAELSHWPRWNGVLPDGVDATTSSAGGMAGIQARVAGGAGGGGAGGGGVAAGAGFEDEDAALAQHLGESWHDEDLPQGIHGVTRSHFT